MEKWKYKEEFFHRAIDLLEAINKEAEKGWRMVAILDHGNNMYRLFFEQKIPADPPATPEFVECPACLHQFTAVDNKNRDGDYACPNCGLNIPNNFTPDPPPIYSDFNSPDQHPMS